MYGPASPTPPAIVARASTIERPTDWLKTWFASARSLRPTACDTSVTVPTPSICVSANTRNITLPAALTPASAASPRPATK